MRPDTLDGFEIAIYHAERSKLKFAAVAPSTLSEVNETDLHYKIKAYREFHLAIKPDNSVALFEINEFAETGSPVLSLDGKGKKLYHIPLSLYPRLDEIIKEELFIVSDSLLKQIIENGNTHESIYVALTKEHKENGLTVLGLQQ